MRTPTCPALIAASAVWFTLATITAVYGDEADDQFAVAAGHYDRQQWKLAVEEFRTFLAKYPRDRRVNEGVFFLGEALLQSSKLEEARQNFREYATREPAGQHARAALYRSGEVAYLAANFAAAKPDLESFLAKYPNDRLVAYVLPYLGDIGLANNDFNAAAGYFRDALKRFPDGQMQDDCRFGLARALEKLGQREEAERLFRAVAEKPGAALADAAQFHLGALQYAAGRYDQALISFAAFDGRLTASSWRPNALVGRGLALLKLNRPAEATGPFDAVLATAAAGAELHQQALRGKVQAALQMKDYAAVDRAVADFQRRFVGSFLSGEVQQMLARGLIERKEYARAADVAKPLLEWSPARRDAWTPRQKLESRYLLAASYEGLKRYEEALAVLLPVVDAADGPLKADAQLTYGSLLLSMKKYAAAIAPLEAFLQGKPQGDAALKGAGELAVCYARTGQLDKAKKVYAELLEKNRQHPLVAATTEILAEAAYDANDTAWSAELSARLAAAGNSADDALKGKSGLAWSLFKSGKLAEAAATFDEVLKKNPPEALAAEAALVRGQILEQLGQDEAALSMYGLVIDKYPRSQQHVEALLSAARLREKLKQPGQAAVVYGRLAKEYPQFPKLDGVLYHWAWALEEMNRPQDAGQRFERLHKEFPQSRFWADATCRLADRELGAKHYDAASSLIDEVLDRKPPPNGSAATPDPKVREYALFVRGQIAVAKGDWPKSRKTFEALLKEFPDSQRRLVAEFGIAEAYYRQGDYAAAGPRFQRLAQQVPTKRDPWMAVIPLRHAQVLAQQNRWADAQAVAAKIAVEFPDFPQQYEVDYLLGRCLASQADFEGARQAYGRVIRSPDGAKTETAAMAQWMIGESFFHQKNYEAAVREYLRLEILYGYPTWQAAALLQAAKCRQQLGEAKEAADLYQRILKIYPTTTFAGEATQRLKSLGKSTASRM